jgi:hypothetical protein
MKPIYQILIWIATSTLYFWFLSYNFWVTDTIAGVIVMWTAFFVIHRNYLIAINKTFTNKTAKR